MQIKKVHCLFEQSGTFKNEFIKLGIPAEDYDIQDNFNQTDHQIDLFEEIETEYNLLTDRQTDRQTIFAKMDSANDLVLAFFPCIYFETIQQLYFALCKNKFRNKSKQFQINYALDRLSKRTKFHAMLYKLLFVAYEKKLRLVIENPATTPNYLITGQNFPTPTIIDNNRLEMGDYFKKPTAYWFVNCEPETGFAWQNDKEQKIIDQCRPSDVAGLCSEERSMISPDYARNWIKSYILGIDDYSHFPLFENI